MPDILPLLHRSLIQWFQRHQRPFPWRRNYDPYQIWISEIMLQQTQVERALIFFERWLQQFPDIHTLAAASEDEVLKQWEGLGYYSRAKNIRRCARLIVDQYDGVIPSDPALLLTLPGIGPYTAGAISSIAYNLPVPLVDANIARLFSRLFDIDIPLSQATPLLWQKAREIVAPSETRSFNQGLMELGAMICTPKNPLCHQCPLCRFCIARQNNLTDQRPLRSPGKRQEIIEMATGILSYSQQHSLHPLLFIQQRLADDIWGSLWEFPGGRLKPEESPEQALIREFREETGFSICITRKITRTIHYYTHHKVILHCFHCILPANSHPADRAQQRTGAAVLPSPPELTAAQQYRWVSFAELDQFAFPAGHRKLIDHIQKVSQEVAMP